MIKWFLGDKEVKGAEKTRILESVSRTREELDAAYNNFENVTDDDLVDSYIFEVQAIEKKYEYLLKQAKKLKYI